MPCGVSFLSLYRSPHQQVYLQLPWEIYCSLPLWSVHNFFYRKLRLVWQSICMITNKISEEINLSGGKGDFRPRFLGFDPCIMQRLHGLLGCTVRRYACHDHGAKKATERSPGPNTISKGLLLMTFYQIPCSKIGHSFQRHHRLTAKPLTHGSCYTLPFLWK